MCIRDRSAIDRLLSRARKRCGVLAGPPLRRHELIERVLRSALRTSRLAETREVVAAVGALEPAHGASFEAAQPLGGRVTPDQDRADEPNQRREDRTRDV